MSRVEGQRDGGGCSKKTKEHPAHIISRPAPASSPAPRNGWCGGPTSPCGLAGLLLTAAAPSTHAPPPPKPFPGAWLQGAGCRLTWFAGSGPQQGCLFAEQRA